MNNALLSAVGAIIPSTEIAQIVPFSMYLPSPLYVNVAVALVATGIWATTKPGCKPFKLFGSI